MKTITIPFETGINPWVPRRIVGNQGTANGTLAILIAMIGTAFAQSTSAALVMTPGNIVAVNSVFFSSVNAYQNNLFEFTPGGTQVGFLAVQNPFGSSIRGLSIIGGNIYLSDVNARVGDIDLTTGIWNPDFLAFGGNYASEGLGNLGNNLLVSAWGTNLIGEYTTSGTPVRTLSSPSSSITGIDASSTQILTVDYFSSTVFAQSSATGTIQLAFNSGLISNTTSGLAHDPSSNSLLISNGYGSGSDAIFRYSTSGSFQGAFLTPLAAQSIYGIDVVPLAVAAVPEPTALAAWSGFAGLGLAMGAVRRRSSRVGLTLTRSAESTPTLIIHASTTENRC